MFNFYFSLESTNRETESLNLEAKLQSIEAKYTSALAKLKEVDEKSIINTKKCAKLVAENPPVEVSRVSVEYPISGVVNNHKGIVSEKKQ